MSDTNKAVNQSGDNIDITRIPNEDADALANAIETFYKQDGSVKTRLSYHWERTQRFLDGDQWLVFTGDREAGGQWNRLQVSKANEYIPRPVTNYMFDIYQTLKSYLTKTKPRSKVMPCNPRSFRDKMAAKVAELCIEANYERLHDQENYEYAAAVLLTYGTVFKKTYWDTTAGNTIEVPSSAPALPPAIAAQGMLDDSMASAMAPETLANETISIGDVNTAIIEPFRIALDPMATDLHTARWIMEYAIQPLSWVRDTYGKEGDGYTGRVDEVKEETALSGSMRRFYQLKNSSGVKSSGSIEGGNASDGGGTQLTNCAVVKEYYEKPSLDHPRGRMVVVANGVTLYAGDTPIDGLEQGDWHPYSDCRWEIVPGRFWGKSPLDNICELQKRANSIMATIILTRKTMAVPQKLVPVGSGIEPGQWTGRPGQQLSYRAEAGMPQTIPSAGVDPTVLRELEMVVEDMKTISGAIDILKGDRPPGVNAASALSLLYEVGTGKIFPVLDRWKRFIERDQKKQLVLIAKNYKEPRPDYIALLKRKNSELSEAAIDCFLGTDLYDNCNVIVEAGSNVPKLESMKQMRLQEAAQVGAVDLSSPFNRMEYQRQMGIVGFDNDIGPDAKRAEWENDCLDNIVQNPDRRPVVLDCDDHAVHLDVLHRRMKEPSWMELPPEVQQAYMQHAQEHSQFQQMQQQMEMMQAAATGQPPQSAGSAGDPTKTKSQGKGAPASLRETAAKADVPPASTPEH